MSALLDKTIVTGFLILLVFTALAHGAVEFWSVAIASVLIVLLAILWIVKAVGEKIWNIYLPTSVWPLFAFIVWGLIQSLPWMNLSLDIEATRQAVLWLVLVAMTFVLAANIFTERKRIEAIFTFFSCFGLVLALFAFLQQATWNGKFYWLRTTDTALVTMPFGPFVHHGHYAGYIDLLLPIPIAFLITQSLSPGKKLLYGFAAALMGLSVIVSLARGGMLGLGAQMLFLAIVSGWMARKRRMEWVEAPAQSVLKRVGAVVMIGVLILMGVFWIGIDPVIDRIAQGQITPGAQAESFFNNRGWIWRDAWAMFRAHPFTGVGLGAFETAFSIYSQSDGSLTVSAAHNDYLQILAESGVIGGALAIWFIVAVFQSLRWGLRSRNSQVQALAVGGGAGIVGMLVHSFFDFNLQLPSHALLFLTIVAVIARLKNEAPNNATIE